AASGQGLVDDLVGEAIAPAPRATMELQHHRERPRALRPIEAREHWRVAVADVLDVLDLDVVAHDWLLGMIARSPRTLGDRLPAPNVAHLAARVKGSVPRERSLPPIGVAKPHRLPEHVFTEQLVQRGRRIPREARVNRRALEDVRARGREPVKALG